MNNLMIGQPGGGKSYEANVMHILPALRRGRKVITNLPVQVEVYAAIDPAFRDLLEVRMRPQPIRGNWTVGNDSAAYTLFPDGRTEGRRASDRVFGNVWDYWTEWRHEKGFGPLYVIDECHLALPKMGTDSQVEEWFSLHRHFNADILLITQSYGKMNPAIRDTVQLVYRVKKAVAFGAPSHYIRKVQDGIRGEVVNTETRKYEKQYFQFYKSHTQGQGVEEFNADDVKPLWKHWTFKGAALMLLLFVGMLASGMVKNPFNPANLVNTPNTVTKTGSAPSTKPAWLDPAVAERNASPPKTMEEQDAAIAASGPASASAPAAAASAPETKDLEPYAAKGVHLTGSMTMGARTLHSFAISQNGLLIGALTNNELEQAGYKWTATTSCTGVLEWKGKLRNVVCDSPQISMGINMGAAAVPRVQDKAEPPPQAKAVQDGQMVARMRAAAH